ncbi:unnamed protein product [Trichogramma brassicae]|uniref:Uncharacterized protein n=1 Tax=Trichogramma brassicae TaxID=86971 RepID=A0A6H5INL8_9HYME|nr:unnamed protein product [Trichogramma brassicae]
MERLKKMQLFPPYNAESLLARPNIAACKIICGFLDSCGIRHKVEIFIEMAARRANGNGSKKNNPYYLRSTHTTARKTRQMRKARKHSGGRHTVLSAAPLYKSSCKFTRYRLCAGSEMISRAAHLAASRRRYFCTRTRGFSRFDVHWRRQHTATHIINSLFCNDLLLARARALKFREEVHDSWCYGNPPKAGQGRKSTLKKNFKSKNQVFFIDDQRHSRVQVDARDASGNTPLYHAVKRDIETVTKLLLRNGANPNSANENRETPLHVICKGVFHFYYHDMADIFFKTCDENHLQVKVDAVDNLGRTPLQLAVANLVPNAVDVFLDRGADVSRFAFPTEIYYGAGFDPQRNYLFGIELTMASGALALDSLKDRGYELDRSDALTVMKFFAKHGLFEKSPAIEKWLNDEESAKCLIEEMIKPDLSLYDLIQLRPAEAAKQVTYMDYHCTTRI